MAKTYSTNWQKKKATAAAVKKFEDQFSKDFGVGLTTDDAYEVVSTGSMDLDRALSIGGIPTGRIIEVWGPEHAGKTTLMMLLVKEYQQQFPDQKVAWVDMEQTFDPTWADALGVDVEALWRPQVKTAEDTADATKRFVESGLCSLVVLDSIGGMIAKIEMEKNADEETVGRVPKIVTRMVKQVSPMAKANSTTVAVVNQVRAQIGGYGPSEITGGGWALKHVTSIKMQVRRGESRTVVIDGEKTPVGHQMMIRIQKNKMAPYGNVAGVWLANRETDTYGPVGIDLASEVFNHAKRLGLMGSKGGGYYSMPDDTEIRGEPNVVQHLRDHVEHREILRSKVLAHAVGAVEEDSDPTGMADMADD